MAELNRESGSYTTEGTVFPKMSATVIKFTDEPTMIIAFPFGSRAYISTRPISAK